VVRKSRIGRGNEWIRTRKREREEGEERVKGRRMMKETREDWI
jgi:hypothetical protein